jgi:negative regulator of sigma E activity
MDIQRHEELISAYLDGELTGDELRTIEALLAESEEARQMLDELRSLQSGLRSLPKYSLDTDFSQAVLDRAERAMLTGEGAGEESDTLVTESDGQPENAPSPFAAQDAADRAAAVKRRIVWSVLAVAAAVLVMIFVPQTTDKSPTALNDDAKEHEMENAASAPGTDCNSQIGSIDSALAREADWDEASEGLARGVDDKAPAIGAPAGATPEAFGAADADHAAKKSPAPGAIAANELRGGAAPRPAVEKTAVGNSPSADGQPKLAAETRNFLTDNDGIAIFISSDRLHRDALSDLVQFQDGALGQANTARRIAPNDKSKDFARGRATLKKIRTETLASGSNGQQLTYAFVEGSRDEVNLTLAQLQANSALFTTVNMNPHLATLSQAEDALGGAGGLGGGELKSDAPFAGPAKQESQDAVDPFAAPVIDEPAPAADPAVSPAAPGQPNVRKGTNQNDGAVAEALKNQPGHQVATRAANAEYEVAKSHIERVFRDLTKQAQQDLRRQRQVAANLPEPSAPPARAKRDTAPAPTPADGKGKDRAAKPEADRPDFKLPPAAVAADAEPALAKANGRQKRLQIEAKKTYRVLVVIGASPSAAASQPAAADAPPADPAVPRE